nr:YdcF family protein [Micromonospora sp. DSM 115978]
MLVAGGLLLSSALGVFTARYLVWPPLAPPGPADAIIMMAGSPGRLERAVALANAGYAPVIVVSTPVSTELGCPDPAIVPGIEMICFTPEPRTTQGEAQFAAQLAQRRGWNSLLVVAISAIGFGIAYLLYAKRQAPAVALPDSEVSLVTVAARHDLFANTLNETVAMRPGQYLTRFLVWLDNVGID